jgi:hypothetical protein
MTRGYEGLRNDLIPIPMEEEMAVPFNSWEK